MPLRVFLLLLLALCPRLAFGQEKVRTCVHVEAKAETEALARLVASEVDRHPSHRSAAEKCATHLKVELVEVMGARFVTGRVNGEVPQRVQVEGTGPKALERAIVELLRIVLGNDPVSLRAPGGQSWFGEKALALRDRGRSTLDFAALQSLGIVEGEVVFLPAVLVGFSREITDWQIGVEAMGSQGLDGHPGALALDTQIRLQATVSHFFSPTADASAFAGASLAIAHQRFSGPVAPDLGGGEATYHATGPAIALRGGAELFRTTAMRAFVMAEVFLPIFVANDQESEIVSAWVPGGALGAGVRF